MNPSTARLALTTVAGTLAVALAGIASAQAPSIERWTIAGGGDVYIRSAEGDWSLSGTLGEWAAAGPQHGSNWTLNGGFWPAATRIAGDAMIFRDGFEAD